MAKSVTVRLKATAAMLLLFLLHLSMMVMVTSAHQDIDALLAFRYLVLDPLQALITWNSTDQNAPCSWKGISCIDGRVSELRLPGLRLQGPLTDEIGRLSELRKLSLRSNRFNGIIPMSLANCSHLHTIYLQTNRFEGPLPAQLANLSELQALNVANNSLNGSIPDELGSLTDLKLLDLSTNNLSGHIPVALSNMLSLQSLNLSVNNLQGQIPPILGDRFGTASFASNPLLCGTPLKSACHRLKRTIIVIAVSAGVVSVLILSAVVTFFLRLGHKRRLPREEAGEEDQKFVMFYSPITYAKALEATGHFDEEHVLSRTRYGIVFKACFQDGTVLSVRRLPDVTMEESAFRQEAEVLGRIKHPNLTVLRGYYVSNDVRLLVYDYMPNGNLATLLQEASHQDGHVLNWPMRHLIALGVARGLAFLHTRPNSPIVHGDVKPHNVQFDADFEAHLSDFGLDRLAVMPVDPSSSKAVGSFGYVSPESILTGQMTKEGDVYSFGIVLLELLTGRRPVMFLRDEDEDIVKWVKRQLQTGQISEVFDPSLLELDPESAEWEEFLLAVKVALLCTAPDPLDRPSMSEVVLLLEGCRLGTEVPSSSYPTSQTSPS